MRKLTKLLLVLFVCAGYLYPPEVRAQETIVVKSGSLTSRGILGEHRYSISADNFAASGYWDGGYVQLQCTECDVGRRLKGYSSFTGESSNASVLINGVSYTNTPILWSYKFYIAPIAIPNNLAEDFVITTPFVMTGDFTASERRLIGQSPVPVEIPFFKAKLTGRGMATYRFRFRGYLPLHGGRPHFTYVDVTYNFSRDAAGKDADTVRPSIVPSMKSGASVPKAEKPQE
jgi:hypothetical protein